MKSLVTRRDFLRTGGILTALAATAPLGFAANEPAATPKRAYKKAIMWATVGVKGSVLEKMRAVKAAGFDGAEMTSHLDQAEVLKAREETGLEIPSVCGERHWKLPLSHPDPKVREEGLTALKQTLRDAKAYGANSILLVPGVVNKDVSFDECWQRSIEQIRLAIPLAEELSVRISIENVWNNFITTESQAVRYLDEINSPWVQWHFDTGNIIRYGDPIAWIKALGKHITRVHVKEYSRDRAMRSNDHWAGFRVPLLEGANNWPGIMKALAEVEYRDYLITEQGGGDTPEGLRDLCQRLEKIIAT
jgi:L-ribulose-5-phosphate 3-epimerase